MKWSHKEEAVLATGAMDRTMKIFDVRQSEEAVRYQNRQKIINFLYTLVHWKAGERHRMLGLGS